MKNRSIKLRVNNIGASPTSYLGKKPEDADFHLSIVCFTKNQYYGELENYLKNGWEDKGSYIYCDHCSIDKNCFHNEETNYVVANLKYDVDVGVSRLESVEDRLLYIDKRDRDDFWKIYQLANDELSLLAKELYRDEEY